MRRYPHDPYQYGTVRLVAWGVALLAAVLAGLWHGGLWLWENPQWGLPALAAAVFGCIWWWRGPRTRR